MNVTLPRVHEHWSAIIGFVLLASPFAFLTIAVHEHYLGITTLSPFMDWMSSPSMNLISPLVFLGGLTVALALNTYALLGIRIRKEGGTLVSMIALTPRTWNSSWSCSAGPCSPSYSAMRLSKTSAMPKPLCSPCSSSPRSLDGRGLG